MFDKKHFMYILKVLFVIPHGGFMLLNWTMAEAKRDFERGTFTAFEIYDSTLMDVPTWSISLRGPVSTKSAGVLVDARTKTERKFRTLDAAVAALRAIGFKAARLEG
ncbi:hypothetical protein [Janthinobacterium agaricidamnosum]|nr:hypothetical protein [Janthinobacterium agaricidamnosum]